MKSVLFCLALAVTTAQAGLVVNTTTTDLTAYGFGTAPSILTLQRTIQETGCIAPKDDYGNHLLGCSQWNAPAGYTDVAGSYVSNVSNKYGTPTLDALGVTSYANLALLFNVNETGSAPQLTLQQLTLTLYDGALIVKSFSLENGPTDLLAPAQGQGSAGFVIKITPGELAGLAFDGGYRVGLAAQIGCTLTSGCDSRLQYGTDDGAESFTVVNLEGGGPPQDVPEPATAALLGGGLLALAWTLRRRKTA